jgi:hypothetical protein
VPPPPPVEIPGLPVLVALHGGTSNSAYFGAPAEENTFARQAEILDHVIAQPLDLWPGIRLSG